MLLISARSRLRSALLALAAALALAGTATIAPAQAAASSRPQSCYYKGERTSHNGVVAQDDGKLHRCADGIWVDTGEKVEKKKDPEPVTPTES